MTPGVFRSQMERLRVLRFPPAALEEFWAALQDIPDELFTAAVSHAARTRAEHPVPSELRADVDAVARRRAPQAVPPTSPDVPIAGGVQVEIKNPFDGPSIFVTVLHDVKRDCDDCDDSGMVSFWCGEEPSKHWPWIYRRRCDRRSPHADHDWSMPCPCVPTNATIQFKKASQSAKYAEEPERVGRASGNR